MITLLHKQRKKATHLANILHFPATEMLSQQAVTKVGKHIILFAVIEADYLVFWIKM